MKPQLTTLCKLNHTDPRMRGPVWKLQLRKGCNTGLRRARDFFLLASWLLLGLFTSSSFPARNAEAQNPEFQLKFFDITDGQLIFSFSQGEKVDIFRIDFAALDVKPLIAGPEKEDEPEFSPDGKLIAFTLTVKGVTQIALADSDGKNIKVLTKGAASAKNPSWSPDGGKIFYQSEIGGQSEIVAMNADGTKPQILVRNGHKNTNPRLSPRGDELLYASSIDWPGSDVFMFSLQTKTSVSLTRGRGSFILPTWHPLGGSFVFIESDPLQQGIWALPKGATAAVLLSRTDTKYLDPCWVQGSGLAAQTDFLFLVHELPTAKGIYQLEVSTVQWENPAKPVASPFAPAIFANGSVRHPSFSPFSSLETLTKRLERQKIDKRPSETP